jgi:NTE family protein
MLRDAHVTLVLGAGGPVGHAFHAGVLAALHESGWDPREAACVVGTSAGAQVAALVRAGMSGSDLAARVTGDALSPEGRALARCFRRPSLPERPRLFGRIASTRYLAGLLAGSAVPRLGSLVAALLPTGTCDTGRLADGLRELHGPAWPDAALWVTALDLDTGALVVFGRDEEVSTDVGRAVASSSAVPGICRPVAIGARRFVDGGLACTHHMDELATDADVVVVSSPLSAVGVIARSVRRSVERLERRGVRVLRFEPTHELARRIGLRFLDARRAPWVARASREAARLRLEAWD